MFTTRARWLMVTAIGGTAIGLLTGLQAVAHLGLAVLLWMAYQWVAFQWRRQEVPRALEAERVVSDATGPTATLWLRRTFTVRTTVRLKGLLVLPNVIVTDRLPISAALVSGFSEKSATLETGQELELKYAIRPLTAGEIRFEGVRVRVADLQGLFFFEHFLHLPQTYRVLPPLLESDPTMPHVKRYNLLPPPGVHRHPRPGIGFELLELRDYVPGDPPRSIAWKVSARRDRLMSKDFESEVPVRCTLLVDASNSVRVGHPGPTALSHLVELAASIAQTAVANRDPVGLCLFDDKECRFLSPGATQRQVVRILNLLAESAGKAPDPVASDVDGLLLQAYLFSREVYPELLHRRVNRVPFRIFPLWPKKRRRRRWRVLMASFLSEYFRMGPADPVRMLHDDAFMAEKLQRFLGAHHVGYEGRLYDERGRYLFASSGKIEILANALTRTVRKGHDNELFLIMADLLELDDALGPLWTAIKVAVARHHRVIVICPWPEEMEPPKSSEAHRASWRTSKTSEEVVPGLSPSMRPMDRLANADVDDVIRHVEEERYRLAFRKLRGTLARLGVSVICASASQSTSLVLAQLEQLRFGRARR